jgi:SH3/ankyrin repeat-containing protein
VLRYVSHTDFRAKDGLTPVHKAAVHGMHRALTALLDLGASPDLRDAVALTPLYHACMTGGSTRCAELLLQDHAQIGVVDKSTWSEVHQATKHGHIGHLYLLCVYVPRSFRLPPFVTSRRPLTRALWHRSCSEWTPTHRCS